MEKNVAKPILKTPKIDACQFLSKKKNKSPIVLAIAEIMKPFYSNMQGCPYVGNLTIKNFSLNEKYLFMLPTGIIRYTCHSTTGVDNILFYVSVLFKVED